MLQVKRRKRKKGAGQRAAAAGSSTDRQSGLARLDAAFWTILRGLPNAIRMDNGKEFWVRAMLLCAA